MIVRLSYVRPEREDEIHYIFETLEYLDILFPVFVLFNLASGRHLELDKFAGAVGMPYYRSEIARNARINNFLSSISGILSPVTNFISPAALSIFLINFGFCPWKTIHQHNSNRYEYD